MIATDYALQPLYAQLLSDEVPDPDAIDLDSDDAEDDEDEDSAGMDDVEETEK